MTTISRTVFIKAPIELVFHFHDDTNNLLKITPPNIRVTIEAIGTPGLGYEAVLKVRQFGLFTMRWHVRITRYDPPLSMDDEQISGPFRSWLQQRRFREVEGGTELTDIVTYDVPFGVLGRMANTLIIKRQVEHMFAYRQERTKALLEST